MSWQILILIQASLMAIATIITRALARDKKTANASLALTAAWFVVLYLCGLAFLPWLGQVHSSNFGHFIWRYAAGGLAFALTNALTYKMLVYLDAAVASIMSTLNALFTIIGAALFLQEDLKPQQAIGAGLLLIAITYGLLATRAKTSKNSHRNSLLGAAYAVGAGIFFALAAVNEKYLLSHMPVSDYLVFGWGGQALMALAVAVFIQPRAFNVLRRPSVLGWTISLGVIRAVAGLCFVLSLVKSNNVALITVISNFKLIIVVILGYWLLKERKKLFQKFLASSGAIASLAVIFWH